MDPSSYEAAIAGDVGFLRGHITDGDVFNDFLLQKTPKDNNVLHIAAEFKQIDFFKHCAPVHSSLFWATNKKGNTPLHVASRVGFDELVQFLIHHAKRLHIDLGADEESGPVDGEAHKKLLRMTNSENDTALHVAARYGKCEVVSLLMKADPELCCSADISKLESPLFLATCKGFPTIAQYILNNSPTSPSFHGINGVTALHVAVTHKYKGIVETMLSKNPEVIKEVDLLGWSPLHYAAFSGNLEATQMMMESNSSASYILDKSGMSALHVAAYAGCIKVMEELIRCRPDTSDLLNGKDQTILHTAVLGGQSNVVEYILTTPKLAGLINEADEDGNTPLHLVAIYQRHEIMRILALDRRVDMTAINKEFLMVVNSSFARNIEVQEINDSSYRGDSNIGLTLFPQQISLHFKILEPPEKHFPQTPAIGGKREKLQVAECSNKDWILIDTNLLVAVLVATVTFSAAVTMPGGFENDGTPVLKGNLYFKLFLVFNVCSFLLSSAAIFIDFLSTAGVLDKVHAPAGLIQYSVGGMVGAFGSATIAVLSQPQKDETNSDAIVFLTICIAVFLFLIYKILRKLSNHYFA